MKEPLFMILASHLSETGEVLDENILFVRWLIIKYRDDRLDIEIDVDAEWKAWLQHNTTAREIIDALEIIKGQRWPGVR